LCALGQVVEGETLHVSAFVEVGGEDRVCYVSCRRIMVEVAFGRISLVMGVNAMLEVKLE
jgi:hypothetical protein